MQRRVALIARVAKVAYQLDVSSVPLHAALEKMAVATFQTGCRCYHDLD